MKYVSYFARHEPSSYAHVNILSFHGIWALCCWIAFIIQWFLPKGSPFHKFMGRFIFWFFLFPLEVTGLILVPYLISNVPRSNIVLSSGYLVVPSMGFHFLITTFRAFPFLRKKYLIIFIKWFSILNFILQIMGSSTLAYKILFKIEDGMNHENNIELFILTLPFSIMQGILLLRPKLGLLGHTFYIKYLTLQMFPGTMIVIARDKYWIFGPNGLVNIYLRIMIEFIPMVPFFIIILPTLLGINKKDIKKIIKVI